MRRKRVLLVAPHVRDLREARAQVARGRFEFVELGDDLDGKAPLDIDGLLAAAARMQVDGVAATKDRAALLAAVIAERLGLPGARPEAILACQHKPSCRQVQLQVVPEATPRFEPLGGRPPRLPLPLFAKPVVGRLSEGARRIDRLEQLEELEETDRYAVGYEQIARAAGVSDLGFRGYLVEELLQGDEVTLEGYVRGGRVVVVGFTDSVKYPGTNSFERFEYPSRLGADRREELSNVAALVMPALGFDGGFFNIEFFVPPRRSARIIEVNARLASQFAPLFEAVHGRSTYDALFALACGVDPEWDGSELAGVAVSYVVRAFDDAFVEAVPEQQPGLELLVEPGQLLSEQGTNDAASYRLCIFVEAAETRETALHRCRDRARALEFVLRPPS